MKQSVTMLSITICGIDCKERSRIFRFVSETAVVGSQVTYKTGDTIECSLPASRSSEIPEDFFDLISNHEGSSLKVESVWIDAEVSASDDAEMNSAEISVEAEKNEVETNETSETKKEGNDNCSEDPDNSSKVTETSSAPVIETKPKPNRGQVALPENFKNEDIEKVFDRLEFEQKVKGTLTVEDKIQLFNELVDELAEVLDIRDSSKKEIFSSLMKLANKCFEKNPEKPVTTRAMKNGQTEFSTEDWNKARNWLGEKVREHDLTFSSFFEYVFRGVKENKILLADPDSIKVSDNNVQPITENIEETSESSEEVSDNDVQPIAKNLEKTSESSEVVDEVLPQSATMPILVEERKDEFLKAFKKIMDSAELDDVEKVKEVLAIFEITSPKAIRLTCESFKYESPFNWTEIAKDAMISTEDMSMPNLLLWFSTKLRKSGFLIDDTIDDTSVEKFLVNLKSMIAPYRKS